MKFIDWLYPILVVALVLLVLYLTMFNTSYRAKIEVLEAKLYESRIIMERMQILNIKP